MTDVSAGDTRDRPTDIDQKPPALSLGVSRNVTIGTRVVITAVWSFFRGQTGRVVMEIGRDGLLVILDGEHVALRFGRDAVAPVHRGAVERWLREPKRFERNAAESFALASAIVTSVQTPVDGFRKTIRFFGERVQVFSVQQSSPRALRSRRGPGSAPGAQPLGALTLDRVAPGGMGLSDFAVSIHARRGSDLPVPQTKLERPWGAGMSLLFTRGGTCRGCPRVFAVRPVSPTQGRRKSRRGARSTDLGGAP